MGGPGVLLLRSMGTRTSAIVRRARPPGSVILRRGGVDESVHRFHAVVVHGDGTPAFQWGDPDRITLMRSAAKPFQALPLVEDGVVDRFGLTSGELALCCASHNAEDAHLAGAEAILTKVGLGEEHLGCGPHVPLLQGREAELHAAGRGLSPITSNCSGKHAGMLALAAHHGWKTAGYVDPEHPVQRRMAREVARWTRIPEAELVQATDGCGVPCYGVPLIELARAAHRFGRAAHAGESAARVVDAMRTHPFMVAGTGRLCTALMRAEPGLFAKVGAEGVYVAGVPKSGIGVALKVEDGSWRSAPPALLAVMEAAGLIQEEALSTLARFRCPTVFNTVGETVGHLTARL